MPAMRIASPERRWRAAAALMMAAAAGWGAAVSVRLGVRPGAAPPLPWSARLVVIGVAIAVGTWLATTIMRTHLAVGDRGLADHRLIRIVRVPWPSIAGFEVCRPSGPWGGYCVAAICTDGSTVDLLSTRAYSRLPSARHLNELHRICWTLEEAARQRSS